MPWLSEEVPDWDALTEKEREAWRAAVRGVGMEFPPEDDDEEDYYE